MEINNRLKEYFYSKGFRFCEEDDRHLTFKDQNDLFVYVTIGSEDVLGDKNTILNKILQTLSMTEKMTRVYLALPTILVSSLDAKIFEEYGIGLINYSEKNILEAIPPKVFEKKKNNEIIPNKFLSDLNQLRGDYNQLKNNFKVLNEVVQELVLEFKNEKIKISPPRVDFSNVEKVQIQNFEGTPSFLKENPWIDVLSKRGKEPNNYVS